MTVWAVVVPVKRWSAAKSRTCLGEGERHGLAIALATDTVHAISATPGVASCLVVGPGDTVRDLRLPVDHPLVRAVEEKEHAGPDGLNAALRQARDAGVSAGYHQIAMVMADLPGLTASSLLGLLQMVPANRAAMIRDRAGTGTTILASRRGDRLQPAFGDGSAARHLANGVLDLTMVSDPALRLDIDTLADLTAAHKFAGPSVRRWTDAHGVICR